MKLYMHPVSNTTRPVRMFIMDNNLPVEEEMVDLMVDADLERCRRAKAVRDALRRS